TGVARRTSRLPGRLAASVFDAGEYRNLGTPPLLEELNFWASFDVRCVNENAVGFQLGWGFRFHPPARYGSWVHPPGVRGRLAHRVRARSDLWARADQPFQNRQLAIHRIYRSGSWNAA